MNKCQICGKSLEPIDYGDGVLCYHETYEYKDNISCEKCFDKLIKIIDGEIIREGEDES